MASRFALARETKTYYVFLASPNDLTKERKIVSEVLKRINRAFLKRGVRLELLAWENLPPGAGRAQEQINELVDQCDLFIGLLNRRWGTPTGTHSSGFEEEFERAQRRFRTDSEPQIWLAFKKIPAVDLNDPGADLERILAFRKEQESSVALLYKEFSTPADWERQLTDWVVEYLNEKVETNRVVELSAPKASEQSSAIAAIGTLDSDMLALQNIATQITDELGIALSNSERSREALIAQTYLSASRLMLSRFRGELLGTHAANLIYKHREATTPSDSELNLLIRTMLSQYTLTNVPGWFWFGDPTEEELCSKLVNTLTTDTDSAVRVSALKLIDCALTLPASQLVKLPIQDQDDEVRSESFAYLVRHADSSFRQTIDSLVEQHPELEHYRDTYLVERIRNRWRLS